MKRFEFIHHRFCLDKMRLSDKKHWMENWEILDIRLGVSCLLIYPYPPFWGKIRELSFGWNKRAL